MSEQLCKCGHARIDHEYGNDCFFNCGVCDCQLYEASLLTPADDPAPDLVEAATQFLQSGRTYGSENVTK